MCLPQCSQSLSVHPSILHVTISPQCTPLTPDTSLCASPFTPGSLLMVRNLRVCPPILSPSVFPVLSTVLPRAFESSPTFPPSVPNPSQFVSVPPAVPPSASQSLGGGTKCPSQCPPACPSVPLCLHLCSQCPPAGSSPPSVPPTGDMGGVGTWAHTGDMLVVPMGTHWGYGDTQGIWETWAPFSPPTTPHSISIPIFLAILGHFSPLSTFYPRKTDR